VWPPALPSWLTAAVGAADDAAFASASSAAPEAWYDPAFLLPLTASALGRTAPDLRRVVELHLLGLALVCLSADDRAVRHAASAIVAAFAAQLQVRTVRVTVSVDDCSYDTLRICVCAYACVSV
jgi:hypothetical protein